jgi:tetratricopeptide (TPR) repeat protein
LTLSARGDLEGAIRSFREAIRLDPNLANAHGSLGNALHAQGDLEGAIRSYRQAIRIDPKEAKSHSNLGIVLRDKGDLEGAIRSLRKAIELLPAADPLSRHARERLAQCKRLLRLEPTLDALLAGKHTPKDAAERIALADIAVRPAKQLYATAVGLYSEGFQAQPPLAVAHRYNAACAAAQAGRGKGKDTSMLDDTQRAHLRHAALAWLQADLGALTRQVAAPKREAAEQSRKTLVHWQKDPDLAAVRDPDLLHNLPEAEQVAWGNLWSQVDALLARTTAAR